MALHGCPWPSEGTGPYDEPPSPPPWGRIDVPGITPPPDFLYERAHVWYGLPGPAPDAGPSGPPPLLANMGGGHPSRPFFLHFLPPE